MLRTNRFASPCNATGEDARNYEAQALELLPYSPISHSQILQSQTLFINDVLWYVEINYEGVACMLQRRT